MVRIHINFKYIDPFSPELDTTIEAWYNRLERQKSRVKGINGDVSFIEIDFLKLSDFLMIMSKDDGSVEHFRPFVKIADADINNPVPDALPNNMTEPTYQTDENGEYVLDENEERIIEVPSRKKTWMEWLGAATKADGGPNYVPTIDEGFHYFYSTAATRGFALSSDELMIVHNSEAELVDERPFIEESPI